MDSQHSSTHVNSTHSNCAQGTHDTGNEHHGAILTQLLHKPPLFMRLPHALKKILEARRLEEFRRFIRIGAPASILLCLAIIAMGSFVVVHELQAHDERLWWIASAISMTAVIAVAILFQFESMMRRHLFILCGNGVTLLALVMYLSLMLEQPRLAQTMTYITMLVITIITLALRLSTLTSALTCLAGGILGTGLALYHGAQPDWALLGYYYMGALCVGIFVAWILERQELINFVQSLLLKQESAERDRLNRVLEQMSREDALSGLANRRHFNERLQQEWDRMQRDQNPLALLFIDVDHFKLYNDTYGHRAGDDCLASIGRALKSCAMRPGDLPARYGGEEFVIILPNTRVDGARDVGQRLLAAVDALTIPHRSSLTANNVTISVGLAVMMPSPEQTPQELVEAADAALYDAKHSGRHRLHIHKSAIAPVDAITSAI